MMCMKKMITGHKCCCRLIGVAMGVAVGFLAANKLVQSCQTSCQVKQIAKKAFKALEENLGL